MSNELSFKEALSEGWRLTKTRPLLWLGFAVTFIAIGALNAVLAGAVDAASVRLILGLGARVVGWYVTFNALAVSLKLIDGRPAVYADFWKPQANFWFYVLATILYSVIIILGLVVLIIPGIILGLMFMFYGYAMVENKLGPIQALKESKRLTSGVKADLFLFTLLTFGINLLGAIALGVGLLVSLAITYFAIAHLYRQRTRALGAPSPA